MGVDQVALNKGINCFRKCVDWYGQFIHMCVEMDTARVSLNNIPFPVWNVIKEEIRSVFKPNPGCNTARLAL